MAKEIKGKLKLQIPGGGATPAPPVGSALGQQGVNIMEFCKSFNAQTQDQEQGVPLPTVITVFADKSFTFLTKTPPASYLIKKAARLQKGSTAPGRETVGAVTMAQLREIAEIKKADLNSNDVEAAAKMLAGSARSMGLQVTGQ